MRVRSKLTGLPGEVIGLARTRSGPFLLVEYEGGQLVWESAEEDLFLTPAQEKEILDALIAEYGEPVGKCFPL